MTTFTPVVGAPVIATTHDGRQLVVIDPEDREQVERLFHAYLLAGDRNTTEVQDMADALRSLVTDPKPEEPQGLGAVVEDDRGVRWVRTESAKGIVNPWQATLNAACRHALGQATGAGKPKWTPYQTQRGQRCDDCYAVIFEAKGEGPASRRARWRRVQGDSDLLLCYAHAHARRVADGLEEDGE